MKSIAVFFLVVLVTASCYPVALHPLLVKRYFHEALVKTYLPDFIQNNKNWTLLPEKDTFNLTSFRLTSSEQDKNYQGLYILSIGLTLEDEEHTVYQGYLKVVYNETSKDNYYTRLVGGNVGSWNATLSTNQALPLYVEIKSPFHLELFRGRNITKEIHDQAVLRSLADLAKNKTRPIIENLGKEYDMVNVSSTSRVELLSFNYQVDYNRPNHPVKNPSTYVKVLTKITAARSNGTSHVYDLYYTLHNLTEFIENPSKDYILSVMVNPHNESQGCQLLKNESVSQAIKILQEKKLLPVQGLNIKESTCEVTSARRDDSPYSTLWDFTFNLVLEDSQKVKYEAQYVAYFGKKTGLYEPVSYFRNFIETAPQRMVSKSM